MWSWVNWLFERGDAALVEGLSAMFAPIAEKLNLGSPPLWFSQGWAIGDRILDLTFAVACMEVYVTFYIAFLAVKYFLELLPG